MSSIKAIKAWIFNFIEVSWEVLPCVYAKVVIHPPNHYHVTKSFKKLLHIPKKNIYLVMKTLLKLSLIKNESLLVPTQDMDRPMINFSFVSQEIPGVTYCDV